MHTDPLLKGGGATNMSKFFKCPMIVLCPNKPIMPLHRFFLFMYLVWITLVSSCVE